MRQNSRIFLAMLVLMGLYAAPAGWARETFQTFNFDQLKQNPAALSADYVKSFNPYAGTFGSKPAMTLVKKVAIAGFEVVFQEAAQENVKGGGLIGGITKGNYTSSKWKLEVKGLTPELRQSITETAYNELKTTLNQAGYEVVPTEQLVQNASFASLVKSSEAKCMADSKLPTQYTARIQKNEQVYVVPKGLPLIEQDSNLGFAAMGNQSRINDLGAVMTQMPDTSFITVVYRLDTEKLTSIGGFAGGGGGEKDRVFGLMLNPGSSMTVFPSGGPSQPATPTKAVQYALKKPVAVSEAVGEGTKEGENYGSQALGAVLKVNVKRVRRYEVIVDPTAYQTQSSRILGAANQLMLTSIQRDTKKP